MNTELFRHYTLNMDTMYGCKNIVCTLFTFSNNFYKFICKKQTYTYSP